MKRRASNFVDLTGRRFGRLTVIKYLGSVDGNSVWRLRCDCGTIKDSITKSINERQSCGCLTMEKVAAANKRRTVDLVGQRFDNVVVTRLVDSGTPGPTRWEYLCDCGRTGVASRNRFFRNDTITHKTTTLCPVCIRKDRDITGQRFGRLVAVQFHCDRKKNRWEFRCDCGTVYFCTANGVLSGDSRSCGCLRRELLSERMRQKGDLTGRRFGRLTVTRRSDSCVGVRGGTSGATRWEYLCDCGRTGTYLAYNFTKRGLTSCGGCRKKPLLRDLPEYLPDTRHGMLTVVGADPKIDANLIMRCDCGNMVTRGAAVLRKGNLTGRTMNCGCYKPQEKKSLIWKVGGESLTTAEVCDLFGLTPDTFLQRMKAGMLLEEAISRPMRRNKYRKPLDVD